MSGQSLLLVETSCSTDYKISGILPSALPKQIKNRHVDVWMFDWMQTQILTGSVVILGTFVHSVADLAIS